MKRIIIALTFLISGMLQSQNIDLLHKANKCDLNFAKSLSDEICKSAKEKYVYLTSKESNYLNIVTFVYIKDGLNESDVKSIEANISNYTGKYELELENALCIHFKVNKVGVNTDLEIVGTKEYAFDVVKGKFLDIFPFYQNNIDPTATTEKINTIGIYSTRKDKEGYWYNFSKSRAEGIWYLKNMSNRLN